MRQNQFDRALRKSRAQTERKVRGSEHLADHRGDQPREAAAAVLGRERHGPPTRGDELGVGIDEAVRRRDNSVRAPAAVLFVADAVERPDYLRDESGRL